MKLEEIVEDIRISVAGIQEKLNHTVTWKELVLSSLTLFATICAAVWFLVGQRFAVELSATEKRLNQASLDSVEKAKGEILADLQIALQGISSKLDEQQGTLVEVSKTVSAQASRLIDQNVSSEILSISDQLTKLESTLAQGPSDNAAFVTFDATSPFAAQVKRSPEWDKFLETWGIDPQTAAGIGQISIPIGRPVSQ